MEVTASFFSMLMQEEGAKGTELPRYSFFPFLAFSVPEWVEKDGQGEGVRNSDTGEPVQLYSGRCKLTGIVSHGKKFCLVCMLHLYFLNE